MIRPTIQALKGYRLAHQSKHIRVKLNQNESPSDLPSALKKKVIEKLKRQHWNRYPSPYTDELRTLLSRHEDWPVDGIVVSGGSNVLIQAITIATAVKGKVLTVSPAFSLYPLEGKIFENEVITVPLHPKDFSLQIEKMLKAIQRKKPNLILLANPNAPTGTLFREQDLLRIIKASSGIVVIDEAYFPFSGTTLKPFLKKYKNLILLRTFSKAFSLGGVRLGYMMAHPEVASEIIKVMLPFTVGLLSQAVAEVVLKNPAYVKKVVSEIVKERERVFNVLQKNQDLQVYPSAANYLLVQTSKIDAVLKHLDKNGVLVRDVREPSLPEAFRVTIGSKKENDYFLKVMKAFRD